MPGSVNNDAFNVLSSGALYKRIGVSEYWVVDVQVGKVTAFEIANGRCGQIQDSVILPGLAINIVEEALRRGQFRR